MRPLLVVSNMPTDNIDRVTRLGTSSVRAVGFLGSTSTTVCNTGTTNNIVLMAAGHPSTNGAGIRCDNSIAHGVINLRPHVVDVSR